MSLSQLESIFSHPLFIFKRVNSLLSQTIHSTSIMSFKQLRFKKLSNDAYAPTKGSKYAAGYDLYAAHDGVVRARGKELIKTDIAVAIPSGCYGRVAPRSGLAWKHSIDVGAGVIDQDYRGNVGVILFNLGENDFQVNKGDRIAQLICEQIADTELVETEDLDQTNRGENGFGSTGVSVDKKIKSEC